MKKIPNLFLFFIGIAAKGQYYTQKDNDLLDSTIHMETLWVGQN